MSEKCESCGQPSGAFDDHGFLRPSYQDLERQLASCKAENDAWKVASGLNVGSDPEGVTPSMLEDDLRKRDAENARLAAERDEARAACAAARELLEAAPSGEHNHIQFEGCTVCAIPPEALEELHSLDGLPNPGQAILDRLAKAEARTCRVCPCGALVVGALDHPCDKCGSLGGELIETAWAKVQARINQLEQYLGDELQGSADEKGKRLVAEAEVANLKRYEAECERASALLQEHFGLPVGCLCVADGIGKLLAERDEWKKKCSELEKSLDVPKGHGKL
jgi:hypothetical protein